MSAMAAKVYNLNDFRKDELEISVDDVVDDWTNALHRKIVEIHDELGASAAYQFHHRVCGTDLDKSRLIVDIIVEHL